MATHKIVPVQLCLEKHGSNVHTKTKRILFFFPSCVKVRKNLLNLWLQSARPALEGLIRQFSDILECKIRSVAGKDYSSLKDVSKTSFFPGCVDA